MSPVDLLPQTPRLKTQRLDASRPEDITRAAAILRAGGLVAFPTETVYGLGANALSLEAVEKIFVAKQRPHWDPLIVHIATPEMLDQVWHHEVWNEARPSSSTHLETPVILSEVAQFHRDAQSENPEESPATPDARPFSTSDPLRNSNTTITLALIERFWPGPLTLLLPRTPAIPDAVTAGRPLVGVRMPAHPVALELIRQTGFPIAAPSANLFGHTSPTTAAHVLADLDGRIDAILDGGPTTVGLESTVAAFEDDRPYASLIIYRPGAITPAMLSGVAGVRAHHLAQNSDDNPGNNLGAPGLASETWEGTTSNPVVGRQPRPSPGHVSPGMDLRHYAPRARLLLVDGLRDEEILRSDKSLETIEDSLVHAIDAACDGKETIGVLLPGGWNPSCAHLLYPWGDWRDGETLARRLFAGLHDLDNRGATVIIAPIPPTDGIEAAIRDRLRKAARPT